MPGRAVHEATARESGQIHGFIYRFQTDGNGGIFKWQQLDYAEMTVDSLLMH